jgi:hypothetical protein
LSYQRMTVGEKQRYHRDSMREPPMRCPVCDAAVQPEGLLQHQAERCPGKPAPHPRGKWVTFREALQLGANRGRLSRWVERGRVRVDGQRGGRRYLLRDVASQVAAARLRNGNRGIKALTNVRGTDRLHGMAQPLTEDVRTRLRAMAESAGGADALSRKIDIPGDTLRRAMGGAAVRKGTRVLIETQMEKP